MANKKQSDADKRLENVEGALNSTESVIEKYQNQISWGLLIIILVVFGIFALNKYVIGPRGEKASYELSKAEYFFGEKNWQVALEGDSADCIGFVGVLDQYGSTKAGHVAKYYAGVCSFKLGNFEDAADYLEGFSSDNKMLNLEAQILLGDTYVELNEVEKAVSLFEKVGKKNNQVMSPRALKKAGIAYESLNKKADALRVYQKIKDDFNSSDEARDIDKFIARVK
jgi:tetratricopeptide (TPR) repeat protein